MAELGRLNRQTVPLEMTELCLKSQVLPTRASIEEYRRRLSGRTGTAGGEIQRRQTGDATGRARRTLRNSPQSS